MTRKPKLELIWINKENRPQLEPSLLEKDKWGNWVVNKQYNPAMRKTIAEIVRKASSRFGMETLNRLFSCQEEFDILFTESRTTCCSVNQGVKPWRPFLEKGFGRRGL